MRVCRLAAVIPLLLIATLCQGVTYTWFDVGTDWTVVDNWRTNAPSTPTKFIYTPPTPPGPLDIASFTNDASIANQPVVGGPQSIFGLSINDNYKGWNFTGGTGPLTVGNNGLAMSNGDYNSPRPTTIGIPVIVTGTQKWTATSASNYSEWGSRASLLITNSIGGAGSIVFSGPSIVLTSTNGLTFSGGSRMTGRTRTALQINGKVITSDKTFGMGGGPITLDGGWFQVGVSLADTSTANLQFFCTNAIIVTTRGGVLDAAADPRYFPSTTAGANPTIRFTGPIALGGALQVSGAMYWYASPQGNADSASVLHEFRGPITLNHTGTACLQLYEQGDARGNDARVTGTITDGTPHTYKHPLILAGVQNYLNYTGTGSTYRDGTVIDFDGMWDGQNPNAYTYDGGVRVNAGCLLGNGEVTVHPAGLLTLGNTNCVSLGTGARIRLRSASNALSLVQIGGDSDVAQVLSSDAFGAVGLSSANTKVINQSALGNGNMFLGGAGRTDTLWGQGTRLSATALAACRDGQWRFGCQGPWFGPYGVYNVAPCGILELTQNNVISGSGTVQVGDYRHNGGGYVRFQRSIASYTGTFDIRVGGVIATPLTGAGNGPLGDPNGNVLLHNGLLRVCQTNNAGVANTIMAQKNNVSFEGGFNMISVYCGQRPDLNATPVANWLVRLGLNSLTRVRRGNLLIDSSGDRFFSIGYYQAGSSATRGLSERVLVTNAPPVVGSMRMAPPCFATYNVFGYNRTPYYDFAAYRSNTDASGPLGFDRATNSSVNIASATITDLVWQAATTLTANAQAYAIKMNGTVATNSSAAPVVTLGTNGYAGIMANGSYTFSPALDGKTNELVIWTTGGSLLLTNRVSTSGGLTKAGENPLYLFSAANAITNTITVNRGVLFTQFDSAAGGRSLGGVNNRIVLNGGYLSHAEGGLGGALWPPTGDRLLASRTIELGPLGGAIGSNLNNKNLYIYSLITGPGEFRTADHANAAGAIVWLMNGANDYSGGTRVTPARDLRVAALGRLGTGDVIVEPQIGAWDGPAFTGNGGVLRLYGSNNLGPTARLWVFRRDIGYAYMYTNTCNVASIGGTGNLVLGRTAGPGNDTTMVIGADDSSCDFYGVIQQAAATSPGKGGVTKVGNGTFTLYNDHSYTLDTTVNGGKLALMGSVASNVVVNAGGALGGLGRIKGNLTIASGGKLAIEVRGDTDYDAITVDKIATLNNAAVEVTLAAGYKPTLGRRWTILSAGTCSGSLASQSPDFTAQRVGNAVVLSFPPKSTVLLVQ